MTCAPTTSSTPYRDRATIPELCLANASPGSIEAQQLQSSVLEPLKWPHRGKKLADRVDDEKHV